MRFIVALLLMTDVAMAQVQIRTFQNSMGRTVYRRERQHRVLRCVGPRHRTVRQQWQHDDHLRFLRSSHGQHQQVRHDVASLIPNRFAMSGR